MNRTLLALLLVAAPILSAGQSDAPVPRPEIRVGDSWTYRSTNLLAPGTHEYETRVSFADDKVILVVSTRKSDGKEFDSSYTPEWNAVTSYTGFMYRPHTGQFRFPLRIGDKYEVKFELLQPRVNTIVSLSTGTAKVVGWDTVDVPAGKFHAMKVEQEGVTQRFDGSNVYQATYWYVPEVRRWVKFQFLLPKRTVSEELLEYKLNETGAHLQKLPALFLLAAAPLHAQDQEIQKQLIQRQQQSDSFTLQLRQSQELLKVPPARRQEAESRQLAERQRLDNVNERQLRDVKPDTPEELRPFERAKAQEERRLIVTPVERAD